jgi:DNA-binding IclR family transcriptional regulator
MLKILSLFTVDRSELTVEQVAAILGSTSSTTYRYFASLSKAGLIARASSGRYIVGPAAIHLDWLTRNTDPMLAAAKPAMNIVAGAINHPTVLLLCRLYQGQVMCVAQESVCSPAFAPSYQRGRPMPLFRGAASKIILANLSDRGLASIMRKHQAEMTASGLGESRVDMRKNLRAIRTLGFSLTRGELDKGFTGLGAPIMFRDDTPGGSLALVLADKHATATAVDRLSRLLTAAAAQVTAALASA